MTDTSSIRVQAKQHDDAQEFEQAGRLYHQLWDEHADVFSGSRYVHCLRKAGHATAALTVAHTIADKHPDDVYVRRELVWALYEAEVKPAKERGELNDLVKAGQQVVDLTDEELPVRLVSFAIIDLAKDKMKWPLVSVWCDRMDPQKLSPEPREMNGRRVVSEREQWYFAKVKALVELKHWNEARRLGQEAQQAFPRQRDFARWAAQALAGQGLVAEAIAELETLAEGRQPEWYLLHDLAEMQQQTGQVETAYQTACRAALAFGEDKAKVNLYLLTSQLALTLQRFDVAIRHTALSQLVRAQEGWPVSGQLVYLANKARAGSQRIGQPLPDPPQDLRDLRAICRQDWEEAVPSDLRPQPKEKRRPQPLAPQHTDGAIHAGQIKTYRDDRGFGFIVPDDGSADLFFHISNVRGIERPEPGQAVRYQIAESPKGPNAVNVRLA